MNEVSEEANRRQPELLRRLLDTYTVNPLVCAYQAYGSKLHKLKKRLKKADEYLQYVGSRVEWIESATARGSFANCRDLLIRKYRSFLSERTWIRLVHATLAEEVDRVESLRGQTEPCDRCRACLSFKKLWRSTVWTTK
jgi:hypothetical protein